MFISVNIDKSVYILTLHYSDSYIPTRQNEDCDVTGLPTFIH